MSWRLFGQIILLIVIASLVLSLTKCAMRCFKGGMGSWKCPVTQSVKK